MFLVIIGYNLLLQVYNLVRVVIFGLIRQNVPTNVIVFTSFVAISGILITLGVYALWKTAFVLMILANIGAILTYTKAIAKSGMLSRNVGLWIKPGGLLMLVMLPMAFVTIGYLFQPKIKELFFPLQPGTKTTGK
jgi:hypothetical protein